MGTAKESLEKEEIVDDAAKGLSNYMVKNKIFCQ
jgi:hypothetical protein